MPRADALRQQRRQQARFEPEVVPAANLNPSKALTAASCSVVSIEHLTGGSGLSSRLLTPC